MKEELRNQITLCSYVLTVFVIWLHAGEPLISSIPGQIAVPGFFILSGFLLFYHSPEAGEGWLKEKLKRRVRTLLIPYLSWNLIYFLIYLLFGKTSWRELPAAVLHYSCNPVFWYLYQLILIMLVSPLLYSVLKRRITAVIWLVLIFLAAAFYPVLAGAVPVELINGDALFYFSLGGTVSLHIYKGETAEKTIPGENGTEDTAPAGPLFSSRPVYGLAVFSAGLLVSAMLGQVLPPALINLSVLGVRTAGAFALWFLLRLLPEIPVKPWMRITFFIYAVHYMVIRAVWAAETAAGLNGYAAANIVTYLLMPAVCTAAARVLYLAMKKTVPGLLSVLTGGRG